MQRLLTRVSPEFDANERKGIVVASPELAATYGFTELGYDVVDYKQAPTIVEVLPIEGIRYAGNEDLNAVATSLGIALVRNGVSADGTEPNALLGNPRVSSAMEVAGFQAFRGHVPVSNDEPELHVFWNESTYTVSDPIPTVSSDPSNPYHVELEDQPSLRVR